MPQYESDASVDFGDAMGWRHHALVFVVCLLLWQLLVGHLDWQELIAGIVVSGAVTALFGSRFQIFTGFRFSWRAPLYILSYLGHFMVALVKANFDLAGRVLSPSLPIRPRIVEIRTGLRSPLGRLLLANTITLTPGTLTVDVEDDRLLVHWVYCPEGMPAEAMTRAVAGRFEEHLARFLH